MIDRLLQATVLTFLLALILQLGTATTPPVGSRNRLHSPTISLSHRVSGKIQAVILPVMRRLEH